MDGPAQYRFVFSDGSQIAPQSIDLKRMQNFELSTTWTLSANMNGAWAGVQFGDGAPMHMGAFSMTCSAAASSMPGGTNPALAPPLASSAEPCYYVVTFPNGQKGGVSAENLAKMKQKNPSLQAEEKCPQPAKVTPPVSSGPVNPPASSQPGAGGFKPPVSSGPLKPPIAQNQNKCPAGTHLGTVVINGNKKSDVCVK